VIDVLRTAAFSLMLLASSRAEEVFVEKLDFEGEERGCTIGRG
jgi:hypothetical protein